MKYVSRIQGIQLGESNRSDDNANTKATTAMKCYRIDPEKDIKNGRVTLSPTSTSTLADEKIAKEAAVGVTGEASVQPGDVELWVAFALTVIFIVIGAGVAYKFGFVSTKAQPVAGTAAAGTGAAVAGAAATGTTVATPPVSPASFVAMGFVAGIATLIFIGFLYLSLSDSNSTSIVLILLMVAALIVPAFSLVYNYITMTGTPGTQTATATPTAAAAGGTP